MSAYGQDEAAYKRFKRMEAAWLALAEEQDWLDGAQSPVDPIPSWRRMGNDGTMRRAVYSTSQPSAPAASRKVRQARISLASDAAALLMACRATCQCGLFW
jgi:hypothetical protein